MISERNLTGHVNGANDFDNGPFGFDESVKLDDDQVLTISFIVYEKCALS